MESLGADESRNGDLADAIHSISSMKGDMDNMDLPTDPDAQAAVVDFLDFTEHLPSDMTRSLTLIGKLDEKYTESFSRLHDLTKALGDHPSPSSHTRSDPVQLRADISQNLNEIVSSRTLSHAEAYRMSQNVDRHCNRAKHILAKLEAMAEAYPTGRDGSPLQTSSPHTARTPKFSLRVGDSGRLAHPGGRVKRGPRITVPGEVLAPNEFEYDTYESSTDRSDTGEDEPAPGPLKSIKIKLPPIKKTEKVPKQPRAPRPPGVMGTNVHSAVAGISTSNALAKLKPPPEDAPIGSEHRPWGRLTQWELAKLRKRMKKNAVWQPSTTMINRELTLLERSASHYRAAKAKAEAAGEPFDGIFAPPTNNIVLNNYSAPAPPVEEMDEESANLPIINKGMKLNEQKKAKKESLARQAAEEAEHSARKMAEAARAMKGLFAKVPAGNNGVEKIAETPKPLAKTPSRKRKRESTDDTDSNQADRQPTETASNEGSKSEAAKGLKVESLKADAAKMDEAMLDAEPDGEMLKPAVVPHKRAKTETPIPPPPASAGARLNNPQLMNKTRATAELSPPVDLAPTSRNTSVTTVTTTTTVPLRASSPRKSSTPILPPTKEKRDLRKDVKKPAILPAPILPPVSTPANTRSPKSDTKTPTPAPEPAPTPAPSTRRPGSRGKGSSVKGSSVEPGPSIGRDRPRRPSTVHNTPAPEIPATRPPSRRAKRPAPGPVTTGEEGAAVTVGKRKAAPRKKAGPKKQAKDEEKEVAEVYDVYDDEGNIVDPNEPRYCVCNGFSYGVMICCENSDCEKEWFHLGCVGLKDTPPRTTKWYCPDCRVTLGIGEKGEVSARGKKT